MPLMAAVGYHYYTQPPPPPPHTHRLEVGLSGGLDANMKRESKVYSFEDQKWDAQMRLDKQKRRQTGGGSSNVRTLLKEAKLSQKQHVSDSTRSFLVACEAILSPSFSCLRGWVLETVDI